jgi:hypothetical protein
MDELQERLARVGLDVLAGYGFALAGGYALQAHQLVDRMSEDVDMFTDRFDAEGFNRAVEAISNAYRREGFEVLLVRGADAFARLQVTDPGPGQFATVDLASDFRQLEPVRFSIGPVLAEQDAVASKVAAVFSRGEARDYIDLAGILDSDRWSREELMRLGAQIDAGFSKGWFAEALSGVDRFPDEEFAGYGVDAETINHVREEMRDWSLHLQHETGQSTSRLEPTSPGKSPRAQTKEGPEPRRLPPTGTGSRTTRAAWPPRREYLGPCSPAEGSGIEL